MSRPQNTNGSSTTNKTWSFTGCASLEPNSELSSMVQTLTPTQRAEMKMFNKLPPSRADSSICAMAVVGGSTRSAGAGSARPRVPIGLLRIVVIAWLIIGTMLPAQAEERTLAWLYDPIALQRGMTNENARVWFRLHYTQDPTIPLTNWLAFPATTNTTIKVDVPRTWGFFALNASNYLGLAWCLNMTNVPAPVLSNYVIQVVKP